MASAWAPPGAIDGRGDQLRPRRLAGERPEVDDPRRRAGVLDRVEECLGGIADQLDRVGALDRARGVEHQGDGETALLGDSWVRHQVESATQ